MGASSISQDWHGSESLIGYHRPILELLEYHVTAQISLQFQGLSRPHWLPSSFEVRREHLISPEKADSETTDFYHETLTADDETAKNKTSHTRISFVDILDEKENSKGVVRLS